MKNTKIEWADATLNPVIGCKHGCPYCYARYMNKRFGFTPNFEEPTFFPERLQQLNTVYPKSIFMDSMSDIAFWKDDWIVKVFDSIKHNTQNSYIFLSKSTKAIHLFNVYRNFLRNGSSCIFLGTTITTQEDIKRVEQEEVDFVSIEPILGPIDISSFENNERLKQIIIGAETGNRPNKVIPKKSWIDYIVRQADRYKIKVFMKNSLKEIMGNDFRTDPLIWGLHK